MASRLTTNQEIAGSTPAVVIRFFIFLFLTTTLHPELTVCCPMRLTQVVRYSDKILSTVHRGTAFENRALSLLTENMSMSLTRVGRSHDGGVDLIGWWWVPGGEKPARTCACSVLPSSPISGGYASLQILPASQKCRTKTGV